MINLANFDDIFEEHKPVQRFSLNIKNKIRKTLTNKNCLIQLNPVENNNNTLNNSKKKNKENNGIINISYNSIREKTDFKIKLHECSPSKNNLDSSPLKKIKQIKNENNHNEKINETDIIKLKLAKVN